MNEHELAVELLEHHFKRFRYGKEHPRSCNKFAPQPKQKGFYYDHYVVMHCDCILSQENPSYEEKVRYIRFMARDRHLHDGACAVYKPLWDTYRGKRVNVIRNCTCWISHLDKPKQEQVKKTSHVQNLTGPDQPVYTEPMTEPNPVVTAIKAQIDKIRAEALGPHLDTPIYDQLAREYDAKYSNLSYFETDLGKRIGFLGQHLR